jgi:hypothetical protein
MPPDAPSADAALDAPGPNTTTNLTAVMANTRNLTLAFYGVNTADGTLHVEINKGGYTTCPQQSSPTPEYLLILGKVPPMTAASGTSPGNFLDYTGDMLGGGLGAMASAVTLTNIVYTAGSFVSLDVSATFAAGTVTGHLYATHCASLDG